MSEDEVEVSELQERLLEAQAEVERLQAMAADREARAAHLEEVSAGLRRELEEARSAAASAEERLTALDEESGALREGLRSAAGRYRELALASNPELPGEMVGGETVEEVEASLQAARETVARVRQHLESQAEAGRVPAGAPPRSPPDLSGLSAQEKIRIGLERGTRN